MICSLNDGKANFNQHLLKCRFKILSLIFGKIHSNYPLHSNSLATGVYKLQRVKNFSAQFNSHKCSLEWTILEFSSWISITSFHKLSSFSRSALGKTSPNHFTDPPSTVPTVTLYAKNVKTCEMHACSFM